MRSHCPKIPCIFIGNKIDIDDRAAQRRYKFVQEQLNMDIEFVSAANGANVVKIFRDALEKGLDYKNNPNKDDFMQEVLELLNEDQIFGGKDDDKNS